MSDLIERQPDHAPRPCGGGAGMTREVDPATRMHRRTPAEHAAMGWAHGQYKDGYCFSLMAEQHEQGVAEFKAEAEQRGAEYVALHLLPEYRR